MQLSKALRKHLIFIYLQPFCPMYLVADLGNTRIKLALFNQKGLHSIKKYDLESNIESIEAYLIDLDSNTPCIVSSVLANSNQIEALLNEKFNVISLNAKTTLPIVNGYKTPETLGDDRLANAAGASALFPEKDVLVIDMGTCIKYDFISKNAEYLGGAISPGVQMRFNSLNQNTGRLPLVDPKNVVGVTGTNTEESIVSGVLNGIIFEIEGTINRYSSLYESLTIVFTGGDHQRFVKQFKYRIFARPNLTLEGLYYILKINEVK